MKLLVYFLILSCSFFCNCKKDPVTRKIDDSYQPDVSAGKFPDPTNITNPYYPLPQGKLYTYEGQTEDGLEVVEERRLDITKVVQGITCVVSNFKAYLDGNLIEEAWDWFAQDKEGNVWYFGEHVDNYDNNGSLIDHAGSWEAGIDGAKAGIIMPANPVTGFAYREEYYFNEAEDEAEIIETNVTVTVPFGHFTNGIRTRNWTELEPDVKEEKIYVPTIGLVKEININDGSEIDLISIE